MLTRPTARRTAAALTAALVAVLLVTLGGPARASAHRITVAGDSHAGAAAKSARLPQAVVSPHEQQSPHHLDISTTPPDTSSAARTTVTVAAAEVAVVRLGRDLVTPTGRAPPAL